MINFLAEAAKSPDWLTIVLLVVVVVALFVGVFIVPMFNNKKQQKKYQAMVEAVKVGDTVKTIGGVVGEVIAVHTIGEVKEFVILTGTGDNKTEMTFDINALYQTIDKDTHMPIPQQLPEPVKKVESKDEVEQIETAEETEVETKDEKQD